MKKQIKKKKAPLQKSPIEVVITVCNRGDGEMVTDLLEANNIFNAVVFNGEGTWEKNNASIFTFSIVERDVVACFVETDKCKAIVETLYEDLKLNLKKNGIVFSMGLSSATKDLLQLFVQGA